MQVTLIWERVCNLVTTEGEEIALEISLWFYRTVGVESDLMWDFLDAVQSSNVIQGIDGRRQSSMETENLHKK